MFELWLMPDGSSWWRHILCGCRLGWHGCPCNIRWVWVKQWPNYLTLWRGGPVLCNTLAIFNCILPQTKYNEVSSSKIGTHIMSTSTMWTCLDPSALSKSCDSIMAALPADASYTLGVLLLKSAISRPRTPEKLKRMSKLLDPESGRQNLQMCDASAANGRRNSFDCRENSIHQLC